MQSRLFRPHFNPNNSSELQVFMLEVVEALKELKQEVPFHTWAMIKGDLGDVLQQDLKI